MKLTDFRCIFCGYIERDWEGDKPPRCSQCTQDGVAPIMWKTYPKPGVVYKADGFTDAQKGERK